MADEIPEEWAGALAHVAAALADHEEYDEHGYWQLKSDGRTVRGTFRGFHALDVPVEFHAVIQFGPPPAPAPEPDYCQLHPLATPDSDGMCEVCAELAMADGDEHADPNACHVCGRVACSGYCGRI